MNLLESENINYIELSTDLINDYLKMVNNPNISKLISLENKTYTYDDELSWVNKKLEEKAIIFSMIERKTGNFIGNIELMNIEGDRAEIGIVIIEELQNKHYGTEAMKRVIEYGFDKLGLEEIYLVVFSNNLRAIQCYKKLGFIEYKVVENVGTIDDNTVNDIYMKIKKNN